MAMAAENLPMVVPELPCSWCREERWCALKAEFMPRFVFAMLQRPVSCERHDPDWYKGLEGVRR
jgi:hypothetical protein